MAEKEEEPLCLPADSLAFVQEILRARQRLAEPDPEDGTPSDGEDGQKMGKESKEPDFPAEDWALSQFWYSEDTCKVIENVIVSHSRDDVPVSVACVSTPTIFKWFKQHAHPNIEVKVFEFDRRFLRYGDDFVYYDYKSPTMVRKKFHGYFDWVIVDPPFLSEEVLEKYAQTMELLLKKGEEGEEGGKIVLMTGIKVRTFILEELGEKFGLKECVWRPSHRGGLKNEFGAYTNFEAAELGGWLKDEKSEVQ